MREPRRLAAAGLFATGLVALVSAWVLGNPLGAAPDEFANNVKALASGRGEWLGTPVRQVQPGLSPRAHDWYLRASRAFELPAGIVMPSQLGCMAFRPEEPARCQHAAAPSHGIAAFESPQGTYPPFVFTVVGAAAVPARGFRAAAYAVRAGGAAVCAALWAAAAWLAAAGAGSRLRLLGLAAAVTPMTLFLASAQGTNGVEVAAAVCFWTALLAATREPPVRGAVPVAGAAGALFALSRQTDPLFVAVAVLLVAAFRGPALLRAVRGGRTAFLAAAGIALGGAAMLAWDLAVMPRPLSPAGVAHSAVSALGRGAGDQLRQVVGVFGWLDTRLPSAGYAAWGLVVAGLLAAARPWRSRQGAALLATAATLVALDVGLGVLVLAPNGFAMQTRYVLAVAVGLPLLAAEAAAGHRWASRSAGRWAAAGVAVLAAGQLLAAYVNERRYAVGVRGPWLFLGQGWRPPGGQALWLALAVAGALLLAAAAPAVRPSGCPR